MTPCKENLPLDPNTEANVKLWLEGDYDAESKETIRRLMQENPQEIVDAFYTNLSFGTGGLRGVMGVGCNRMNVYTVRFATQGLANYLNKQNSSNAVFIGYDCRKNSRLFAEEAARVLAGNGIKAYLCEQLRPTPLVSFGCRYYNCQSAIMITASHNPPEYNGYKVYWADGGQILPPHDSGIIEEVRAIHCPAKVKQVELENALIVSIGREVDEAYFKAITPLQHYPEQNQIRGADLNVVFANLHGTGITMIPEALRCWGFHSLSIVEEQEAPDGNFPTVKSPNPEERDALKMGIEQMLSEKGDILLATDPDTDRVGAAVRVGNDVTLLNGNQIASLCLHHICEALSKEDKLPPKAAFVKTIVTTPLFKSIADYYERPCFDVLTGFKYIAEKIRQWEEDPNGHDYIFGGEESYGYLLGTHARDKDAVVVCCLICEVALNAKLEDKTLVDLLRDVYEKYGVFREKLVSLKFPETKAGREQMANALVGLRQSPPTDFAGIAVSSIEDYQSSEKLDLATGKRTAIDLPSSNVLRFELADKSWLVVRPSGTEPKVKLYCGTESHDTANLDTEIARCDKRLDALISSLQDRLEN